MKKVKKVVILAHHNNGCYILDYLAKRKDINIVRVIIYKESSGGWWKSVKKTAQKNNLPTIIFQNTNQNVIINFSLISNVTVGIRLRDTSNNDVLHMYQNFSGGQTCIYYNQLSQIQLLYCQDGSKQINYIINIDYYCYRVLIF